ncbi:MAG: PA14 domain-containing protein [Bacteroidota bacterium]
MIPTFHFRVMLAWLGMLVLSASHAFAQYDPASYNATDPTFPVTYSEVQKTQQRADGLAMMTALMGAVAPGGSYTIAPGVYRLAGGYYSLVNVSNFTINAAGVEIWMEEDATKKSLQWLRLNKCTNIKISGPMTFDSENLQFIQCAVQGWNAADGTIDVTVIPGYDVNFTYVSDQHRLQFNNNIFHYDQQGVNLTRPFLESFSNYDAADPAKKRLNVGRDYFTSEGNLLQVGHVIQIRNNIPGSRNPIFVNTDNTDVEVNGIQCYYGPMWAWGWSLGRFANINCSNYRRPGSNRLGGSEEPGNMDYVDELIYDGCNSGPGQDDGVNALRGIAWVGEQVSKRVVIMHVQPIIGERISFYKSEDWAPEGTALVATEPVVVTDEAQRIRLITQMNNWQNAHGWKWRLDPNQKLWAVTMDHDLSIEKNSIVDRSGNRMKKITARNCYLADMNVPAFVFRGVDEVTIENNVLERGRWECIALTPSRYWWEGPLPHNITIRNNQLNYTGNKYGKTIANTGKVASLYIGLDGDYASKVMNNVTIIGNTFRGQTVSPLLVKNCNNVVIIDNTFITPEPDNAHYSSYGQEVHAAIFVAADSNVTISRNHLVSATGATQALVQVGPYMDYTHFAGTDVPPIQPATLAVQAVSANVFSLTWQDSAPNEDGFILERKVNAGGAYVPLDTLLANVTTYQDTATHTAEDYYFYRIRSFQGNSLSTFSNEASARLPLADGHGVDFNYYEGIAQGITDLPVFEAMTPVSTGYTANFNLSMIQIPEYFGIVYWGDILVPTAGSYTFYTNSDDFCRLYLDGLPVVGVGPFGQDQSGKVTLTAGLHHIRVAYIQGYGGKYMNVSWEGPGFSRVVIPSAALFRSPAGGSTGHGLIGNYYKGVNLDSLALQRIDSHIQFNWKQGSPDLAVNADSFSVRWVGKIIPRYSEEYTFFLQSDNGRRLWVNGQLVINKWIDDTQSYRGYITLLAGKHYDIRVEYFEAKGYASCRLEWRSASQVREVVPTTQLLPLSQDVDQLSYVGNPHAVPGIIKAEYYDLGGEGVAYHDTDTTNAGGVYRTNEGVDLEVCAEGGLDIQQAAGEWVEYTIQVSTSGAYRLDSRVASALGGKIHVEIDGTNVTGAWAVPQTGGWQKWIDLSQTINLTGGQHVLRYFVDNGEVSLHTLTFTGKNLGDGINAQYFLGLNLSLDSLVLSRKDASPNFNWGGGSPDASLPVDSFSVRWTGQILPKYSEEYTFIITSDNGRRLWINNELVIDSWLNDWDIPYSGKITLEGGKRYDIKLEYFEVSGGANIRFEWQSASQGREPVPQGQLYTTLPGAITLESGSIYQLGNKHSGKVLGVKSHLKANGTAVIQGTDSGAASQHWQLETTDSGYYRLTALHSKKVLDISYSSLSNGAAAVQYPYQGAESQQFKLEPVGNGYYKIVARHSGKVLDVAGASTMNGARVWQWTDQATDSQHWMLTPVSAAQARLAIAEEIAEASVAPSLTLSPNPAREQVQLAWDGFSEDVFSLTVVNAQGQKVHQQELKGDSSLSLTTHKFAPGLYMVTLRSSQQVVTKKLLVIW